jgi:hypothetical protein
MGLIAFAVFGEEDGLVLEHGSWVAGAVGGLCEGGTEFGGVVVSEDEEGSEGRCEGFEKFLHVCEGGFPEPGAVSEIAGDEEEVWFEGGEGVLPGGEVAGPLGDVHVGEVEDDETVEGLREAVAGEVEEVDVWRLEHLQWSVASGQWLVRRKYSGVWG